MAAYLVQLVSVIDGKIFILVYKLFATIVLELEPTVCRQHMRADGPVFRV